MENLFTFITVVNNEEVLQQNLLASPCIKKYNIEVKTYFSHTSAARCYNDAISKSDNKYLIFCHQDMYFPELWLDNLLGNIREVENHGQWGVIGCYGVDKFGNDHGHVYSNGLGKILGRKDKPCEVMCLDEIVLITEKESNIRFDNNLSGYHLYGVDLCLNSINKGHSVYAISNFCIHNSSGYKNLPKDFWKAYKYVAKKWNKHTPIKTSVATLKSSKFSNEIYINMRKIKGILNRGEPINPSRCDNLDHLFEELIKFMDPH